MLGVESAGLAGYVLWRLDQGLFDPVGGSGDDGWSRLMESTWGRWTVAAVGVGLLGRGLFQFVKACTASFRDRIRSFELGRRRERIAVAVSRMGLSARGVIFGIMGSFFVFAALERDPSEAGGLSAALSTLQDRPLLGSIGAGLICYAGYQWVKARYRMIDP